MKRHTALGLIVAIAAVAAGTAVAASPSSLTLIGEDGKSQGIPLAAIAALPHETASVTHEGKVFTYEGPLLTTVLRPVNPPLGAALRGAALSDVVIVRCADGYTVALALTDLEPTIRATKVILADRSKGAPLDAKDSPLRLVIDGDLKPARSARQVVSIEVRRLAAPSQQTPH